MSGVPELLMHTPEKSKFYQQRDDKALSWKQRIKGPFDPSLSVDVPNLISLLLINRIRPSQEERVTLWHYSKPSCYLFPWEELCVCVCVCVCIHICFKIYCTTRVPVFNFYFIFLSVWMFFFTLLIWWNAVIVFQILSQHSIQVCNVLCHL